MAGSTLTFTLEGDVTLQSFVDALRKLDLLLGVLGAEGAGGAPIDWLVTDLRAGSAILTISAQAEDEGVASRVVEALVVALRAVRDRRHVPYSLRVTRRAHDLEAVIRGGIIALRVETDDAAVVLQRQGSVGEIALLGAYGAVDGRIETLTSRRDLRFTLFDAVFDRGVTCALSEDRRDLLRDAWGRRAIVEGWVSRDPFSGRPVAIQHVTAIEVLDERSLGAAPRARGVLSQGDADARLTGLRRRERHAF